jgi:23S rRNA (uracil1939-C5)-methyltransferase
MVRNELQIVNSLGDMKVVFNDNFIATRTSWCYDPPRDGMHKDVIEQIMKIAPERWFM